jgi:hypothetical protein
LFGGRRSSLGIGIEDPDLRFDAGDGHGGGHAGISLVHVS